MDWKGRRVFVTGAGGFIGSHLVKRLLNEGAQVHALLKRNEPTWRIKDVLSRLVIWESDITDLQSLQHVLPRSNPQIIFHLAALVDVSRSWDLIFPMTEINLIGTVNLLTALKNCTYEVFIHTTSSEDYGDAKPPLREDRRECPISPYSFSKVSSTFFCQMAAKTFDLPVIVLRLFSVYGPSQESSMFIPSAIKELLLKRSFRMSPGEQKRDFIYVDDVVEAYLKLAACTESRGEVINVGSGIPCRIKEVAEMIRGYIGGDTAIEVGALPYRTGEGMESFCDNQKLKQLTGWSAKVPLREGLHLTVEWYKSYYYKQNDEVIEGVNPWQ